MGCKELDNGIKINYDKGLSFNDVLIVPSNSQVKPENCSTSSNLSKKIKLELPFVGSPMADVSGYEFCIAMAQHGAFSFLHRNCTAEEQADAVKRVKEHEGYIVESLITITPEIKTIAQLRKLREEKRYGFGSFPVVDEFKKPIGIVEEKDWFIDYVADPRTYISTIMREPVLVSVEQSKDRDEMKEFLKKERRSIIVIDKKDKLYGLITGKDFALKENYPRATRDENDRLRVGAAIGVSEEDKERAEMLFKEEVDSIVIDISHGDHKDERDMIKWLKSEYGDAFDIGGGNVATYDAVERLAEAGADFIRVGVGPGSICTTRMVTGVGVPQLTAILECSNAAKEHDVYIIADGGIKNYGDIAKALTLADTVMMGSMFAGVEETPGIKTKIEGKTVKEYKGMGSEASIRDRKGAGASRYQYKNTETLEDIIFSQGVEGYVEYKGPLKRVLFQMENSLKYAMGLVGASNIEKFQKKSTLRVISGSSYEEGKPSVSMTKQPENYFGR